MMSKLTCVVRTHHRRNGLGRRPRLPPVTPTASQQPQRYPPLSFTPDPWRRTGTALLISGPVLLAALMVADVARYPVKGDAEVDGAVADESAEFAYWLDLVFVVTLTLALGAALAGLVLLTLSLIPRTASRTRRRT